MATGRSNRLIRLWDIATQQGVGQIPRALQGFMIRLYSTPDGRYFIANDFERDVVSTDVDVSAWKALACEITGRNFSPTQWVQYIGTVPYHAACPNRLTRDKRPLASLVLELAKVPMSPVAVLM